MTPCGLLSHFCELAPVLLRVRVIFAKKTQDLWIVSKAGWWERSRRVIQNNLKHHAHTYFLSLVSEVTCFPCEALRNVHVSQRYPWCIQMFAHSHLPICGREGVIHKRKRQTGMGTNVGKFRLEPLCGPNSQIHWEVLSSNGLRDPGLETHLGAFEIKRKDN